MNLNEKRWTNSPSSANPQTIEWMKPWGRKQQKPKKQIIKKYKKKKIFQQTRHTERQLTKPKEYLKTAT